MIEDETTEEEYYVSGAGEEESTDEEGEAMEFTEEALESEEETQALIEQRVKTRHEPRIGFIEGTLLLLFALGIDGFQALLDLLLIGIVLNFPVDIIAWLTFYIYFKMKGMSFGFSRGWGKKIRSGDYGSMMKNPLFTIAVAFVVEFIPIISALPAWTLAIVMILITEYATWFSEKTIGRLVAEKTETLY